MLLRYISFISKVSRTFMMKIRLSLSKIFPESSEIIYVFSVIQCLYVVYYQLVIYGSLTDIAFLDEAHVIIIQNLLNVLLNSI